MDDLQQYDICGAIYRWKSNTFIRVANSWAEAEIGWFQFQLKILSFLFSLF